MLLAPARYLEVDILKQLLNQACCKSGAQVTTSLISKFRKTWTITANNGGHNSIAVAEQTLMLILSLMKKSAEGYERVRSGNWEITMGWINTCYTAGVSE